MCFCCPQHNHHKMRKQSVKERREMEAKMLYDLMRFCMIASDLETFEA